MQIYRTVFKKSKFLSWYVFLAAPCRSDHLMLCDGGCGDVYMKKTEVYTSVNGNME